MLRTLNWEIIFALAFCSSLITASGAQLQAVSELPRIEAGYLIGPGDVLSIEVWKHPDISRDVVVNDEGEIRLPPIKSIKVIGMTVPQLEEKLAETLSKYLILKPA